MSLELEAALQKIRARVLSPDFVPTVRRRKKLPWIGRVLGGVSKLVGTVVPVIGAIEAATTVVQSRLAAADTIGRYDAEDKFLNEQDLVLAKKTGANDMSIWQELGGAVVRGGIASSQARSARRSAAMPGSGMTSMFPAAGVFGGVAARLGVGGVIRGAGTYAGRAAAWCRRNPGRCTALGGLTAIEALLSSGGSLPRTGRSRGITSRELRSFRRVTKIISKYCSPVRKAMRAPALKSRR